MLFYYVKYSISCFKSFKAASSNALSIYCSDEDKLQGDFRGELSLVIGVFLDAIPLGCHC